ncbi:MAG: phage tail tape measure protein, partial [Nanoarchaeota archaeon]|nr:phage tail tape measure protein [Nanoarchaeota archaeon]
MADQNAQTRLDWEVTGEQAIKSITTALIRLNKAQKDLNRTLGKESRVSSSYTQMLDAQRKMKITVSETAKGVRRVKQEISQVAQKTQGANEQTGKLRISWQSVGRIIAGSILSRGIGKLLRVIREAGTESTDFEARIGELRTISQNAQLQFDTWADSVKRLSDEFNRAPLDVTEGLYQTLSNQVAEGANAVVFMEEALRLSLITVSSAEEAVQALTAAINAYGYSVADARRLSNIFFKTIELGRLRLGDIANTIGRILILGSQLSITIEEMTASIDAMTIQGVRANEAQTWMRNVMLKLIRPTEALKDLFDEWGVVSGQAAVQTFGFAGVIKKLEKATSGSNNELTELARIFNRIRATTGAAALVGNTETLIEALKAMEIAAKDADAALKLIQEPAGFKIQKELRQIQNFFTVDIGRAILKQLEAISEGFVDLSDAVKYTTIAILATVKAVGQIVGATIILQFLAAFTTASTFASTAAALLTKKIVILGVAFNAATIWLGVVAAASAKLGAALYNNFKNSQKSVDEFTDSLRGPLFTAMGELAARENQIYADRVAKSTRATNIMKRVYLQALAAMMAAVNTLRDIESNRSDASRLLYESTLTIGTSTQKEKASYERLIYLKSQLRGLLKEEKRDTAEINRIWSQTQAAYATINSLESENFRVSQRSSRVMRDIHGMIKENADNLDRLPKTSRVQLLQLDKLGKKFEKHTDQITDFENMQQRIKTTIEETNSKEKTHLADLSSRFNLLEEAGRTSTGWLAKMQALLFKDVGEVPGLFTSMSDVNKALTEAKEKMDELQRKGGVEATDTVELEQLLNKLELAFKVLEDRGVIIKGYSEALSNLGLTLREAENLSSMKDSLVEQLGVIEGALKTVKEPVDAFKKAFEDVKIVGDDAANQLVLVMQEATDSLRSMLEALRIELANTKLEAALIKNTSESIKTKKPWVGGYMTRFASGGSVGSDSIPALLSPGEFVMNQDAARRYFPQLVAMNSGAARFSAGGEVVNNNIGDINVTVQGNQGSETTAR